MKNLNYKSVFTIDLMRNLFPLLILIISMHTYSQDGVKDLGFTINKLGKENNVAKLNLITEPPVSLPQTFCQGALVSSIIATGSDLKWYDVATLGTELSSTEVLTSKMYYVTQTLFGEESARTEVQITIKDNPTPTLYPTPSDTVCLGDNITISANEATTPFVNALLSGGTPVDCNCPDGYVAVGYKGNSATWLDGMQLACKKLNTDGTLDPTIVYTTKIGGDNGLANGPYVLTGNNVLVGGEIEKEYYGNYFSSFTGFGQSVDFIKSMGNNSSSPISVEKLGPSTGTFLGSSIIPNGSVIVGMKGWVSDYVTGVSFIYRPINLVNKNIDEDTFLWSNGATTKSITVNTPGTYILTITDPNGCTGTASQIVIMNPLSVGGSVTGGTTVAYEGASALLTLSDQLGTIVRWESSVSPFTTWTPIANTATTYTSGALTQSTQFRAVVQSGVCSTANSTPTTVSVITDVVWNGSAWSPSAPTNLNRVFMTGDYNSALNGGNITARELTVGFNVNVVIESGHTVTLNGQLAVNGTFTLNNNANLVQIDNISNYGNITIKRDTAPLKRLDYVLWSTPVEPYYNHYLQSFSPLTLSNRFYTYNGLATPNVYEEVASPSTTVFENGKGYLIRMPNDHPDVATIWTGTFTGKPNNGDINIPGLTSDKYYAIGNPYPSTISADSFISSNGIVEPLYFWRKTNNANNSSYASYNTAGGVSNSGGDPLLLQPNGFVQLGQGFIVKTTSTSLNFTNSLRVANTQNQFFKTKVIEKNRIWLNLTSESGVFSQTLVAYMSNATSGVDPAIDGRNINDSPTALNSLINNEEFVIQGRSLPFDASDIVPLAFKTAADGDYTISIGQVDGLFSYTQDIILKDNVTGKETDLKASDYKFTAVAGVDNARFSLKYQKTLGVNSNIQDDTIVVSKNNGTIKITSGSKTIDSLKLFDVNGKLLLEKTKINATEATIESHKYAHQVLIVQIKSEGKIINKKILN